MASITRSQWGSLRRSQLYRHVAWDPRPPDCEMTKVRNASLAGWGAWLRSPDKAPHPPVQGRPPHRLARPARHPGRGSVLLSPTGWAPCAGAEAQGPRRLT